jgi:hypothetical protein
MQRLQYEKDLMLESIFLRISPNTFHFLKFILEAYDNIGIISSCPGNDGIVLVRFSKGFTVELLELLSSLAPQIKKA